MASMKWNAVTYQQLKHSPELQKQYEKQYKLDAHKPEEYWIKENGYNGRYVFLGFDPEINNYDGKESNIKLLKDIINTNYNDWKIKPRNNCKHSKYKNLTRLQIGILIADMFGYRHYQIARILGINQDTVKKEIEYAQHSIARLTIGKCSTCKWRIKSFHKIKKNVCKYWKVKVNKNFFCFLYKEKKKCIQ